MRPPPSPSRESISITDLYYFLAGVSFLFLGLYNNNIIIHSAKLLATLFVFLAEQQSSVFEVSERDSGWSSVAGGQTPGAGAGAANNVPCAAAERVQPSCDGW